MFLRKLVFYSIVSTAALAHASVGPNDKAELTERMHRAEMATSLDRGGLLPWHLKLDVQLFDVKGQPMEKGAIEEWWAGPKMRLIDYQLPSYTGKFL